jgi:hypothetical protein
MGRPSRRRTRFACRESEVSRICGALDGAFPYLCIDVSEAETEAFWTEFPRDLVTRGLTFRRARRLGAIAKVVGWRLAIAKVVGWRLAAPSRTRTAPLEPARCGVMLRRHSQGGQAGRGG